MSPPYLKLRYRQWHSGAHSTAAGSLCSQPTGRTTPNDFADAVLCACSCIRSQRHAFTLCTASLGAHNAIPRHHCVPRRSQHARLVASLPARACTFCETVHLRPHAKTREVRARTLALYTAPPIEKMERVPWPKRATSKGGADSAQEYVEAVYDCLRSTDAYKLHTPT